MKKSLFTLTLAALTIGTYAQSTKVDEVFKKYRFSLFAGPTFNSLRPVAAQADNYAVTKNGGNVGFSFGINADYNINERYTVYTGLGMDWRGGKINAVLPATVPTPSNYVRAAQVKYVTQYLTVPIGLKMTAATFDKIKLQALAGFDFGLLLSQRGDVTYTTVNKVSGNDTTFTLQKTKLGGNATVVPVTLGWGIGIGGEYDLNGKNAVTAQLFYRNGFVDVTTPKTNDDGKKFSDGNVRSNSIAIRIGYTF